MRNTALAIAAPATPKQDKMHEGRVKTMLAHAIAPPLTSHARFRGCHHRLGLPDPWAAPCRSAVPRRRRRATRRKPRRRCRPRRSDRDAYPPRRPPREESKDDDVVARNPIEARLLARERERKAKKPLTAKDLDNKMAEAEERRQLELEAIKFKGAQFSRPAPGPRRTVDYGEEKDSHK